MSWLLQAWRRGTLPLCTSCRRSAGPTCAPQRPKRTQRHGLQSVPGTSLGPMFLRKVAFRGAPARLIRVATIAHLRHLGTAVTPLGFAAVTAIKGHKNMDGRSISDNIATIAETIGPCLSLGNGNQLHSFSRCTTGSSFIYRIHCICCFIIHRTI